ncbi:MAG: IS66 family transposase [Candidatus Melainabacteria bacterium]|nr:IS66 family transposase [Candidatus Melainabacteria bacterium]
MSDEVTRLNAEIHRLLQQNEDLQRQLKQSLDGNEELRELLKDLQAKLDVLIAQSKKRNKKDYGKKTEKHNPRPAEVKPKTKPAGKSNSAADFEKSTGIKHILENAKNLPHEPITHSVKPEDSLCPDCTIETVFVSSLLTHQLEMVSASLKILEHHQETRACPICKQYIVTAEKPCSPIPGSYAGPRLLGEVIVGKLDDGLPNNRQQKIFGRQNVTIPRSTQSDWMQTTANTLSLLYELQKQELLKSAIIKTDDSSIKIQDRKHKDNIRKGKVTTYIGDSKHPVNMFDCSPDLTFDKNLEFLKDFKGIVQADAAGGFDALFEDGQKTEAGCSAHSRRKYFEIEFTEKDICNAVLDIYRDLYKIERDIKDKPPAFRLAMRRKKSKPLVKLLRKIIVRAKEKLNPSHELMKAIKYTLKHWRALTRFLKNPDIAIDNNEAERAIKTWVLVRKNSLFAGSDEGAKAIAVHLSFISTAKRNGINPVDWYADVLARINGLKTNELQQLLPQNWSPPLGPNVLN